MAISQITTLSKPTGDTKISVGVFGYLRSRNRQRAYDLVMREFKKSGLTRADLARRMGKAPEIISRLLNRPRNWTLDTFSDLLFAISGAMPRYEAHNPFQQTPAGAAPITSTSNIVPLKQKALTTGTNDLRVAA